MKQLFLGLFITFQLISSAQNSKKEVLFKINDNSYYTDEFIRVYNKNLDLVKDESQKDLDNYLELFIGYKLKINKAYSLNLQDGESYKSELNNYRNQLAKVYMTDSKVTEELVNEAYNRSLSEIKASHILIFVDENAAPADTLKAFNKINEIRKRALKGEDFGELAATSSEDPSAKENKGDLGYFSVFRMVYPFETAAYKTIKDEISPIFRTKFGYHILKVTEVRKNRGEVEVEHIMILNSKDGNPEENAKAKQKIDDIYQKIKQGENFENLAKQFSEDKSSSSKGGKLNRFASGQLSSEEFENVAFSLTAENPISAPFETKYGWHIVKLLEKFDVKTFEEAKPEIEMKVSKDDRSRLITNSLNEKLRKKYNVKRNEKLYSSIVKTVNNAIYESKWELPVNLKLYEGTLFSIEKKNILGTQFLDYIYSHQKEENKLKPLNAYVNKLYETFLDEQLNSYYKDNLESEFPEFAAVVDEYRDGLLLFDLMEKEIWEKSKTDTIGLNSFYDLRKENYRWKERLDIVILSSTSSDAIKKAQKMLKKKNTSEEIKEKLNTKDNVLVMSNTGVFEIDNDALPKGLKPVEGISEIIKDGEYYFVCKINKVLQAQTKTLEECKGKVINDYQQYLEDNWVGNLKKEYTVKVYQDAFERVKIELKK
ncbi:MAG TPA: peptidylprolyl isomerase [Flavobacterium sp.]|nr:peptidylprolyl isomerase [Flavobacterium sp.]